MISRLSALLLLLIFGLPILVFILISTFDTQQWGLFSHQRVGLHGKPFSLYKIRTLKGTFNQSVTTPNMQRSSWGQFLRKYHIDEWPQLINILFGQLNFVGPRPDTPEMYKLLPQADFDKLTAVKPGITGITQIENMNEEYFLSQQKNPEQYYKEILWPEKVAKNIAYIQHKNTKTDCSILFQTIQKLIF